MNWKDLQNVIGKAAPLVGMALGGPIGGGVGKMLASVLGVEETPEAVSQAIKNDPEALVKLRKFEMENEQQIREMAFKTLDVELKDKQSAREAHKHNHMPAIICVLLTLMVAALAYGLFDAAIPGDNETIANMLFGTLLAKWGDSIAYWVGTTRSSSEKTKMSART
jgi:hypothetical protein